MDYLAELSKLEETLDREVASLPILKLPVRVPLSMLLRVLHSLSHGMPLTGTAAQTGKAYSLAARLSHLVPLLANCPGEPTGVDAMNVMEAYQQADPDGSQGKLLLSYAHFSDLMPEVHRKYFSVVGGPTNCKRFALHHASTDFADSEAEDILLSELALGFLVRPHPFPDQLFDRLAKAAPGTLSGEAVLTIKGLKNHFRRQIFEVPFVDDTGLKTALGVTHEEFHRFRISLVGMATFSVELARAYSRRVAKNPEDMDAFGGWVHWLAPTWGLEFFRGYLITESGLTDAQSERLLSLLSVDFRTGKPFTTHARDGYFPPIWQLPGILVLAADPAVLFTQLRNLLFAVQITDQRSFDDLISKHLEPSLIDAATRILAKLPGLDVKPNVKWTSGPLKGEIDLLVFSATENTTLHIQAKAPLPPQGARLVQRLEGRLKEGLSQLKRFHSVPPSERDEIIGTATGRSVSGAKVVDVVLARSCFGTHIVRQEAGTAEFVSLAILAGAVSDCVSANRFELEYLVERFGALKRALVLAAKPRWDRETLVIGTLELEIPLLNFDEAAVNRLRFQFWRDSASLGIDGLSDLDDGQGPV